MVNSIVVLKINSNSSILIGRIGPVGLDVKLRATENLNVPSLSIKQQVFRI